ncbi:MULTISPECIES: NAD-dependent epimerase [Paenibacillus]|uniref:NAD-dependent epimerase n=1 Tax=Paenibacillus TaxID=44249 RepID=UPI00227DFCA3|nr:NAD-dependent epimerase [Paenibacillus alvei]MCY7486341.1 NAD-dependent epimerase [Paenibacillus alvei]
MTVIITGAAGFIGSHVARRCMEQGIRVVGVDQVNDYYDPALKEARIALCEQAGGEFELHRFGIEEEGRLRTLMEEVRPGVVVHLAAQAGVRYSLLNPRAYVDSNLVGFVNVLEACRHVSVQHLLYASSSSVYGANKKIPFDVADQTDEPVSLYAATKKSNELMAYAYSHLFNIPSTGLRFFTVYGPWGRPDMAYYSFAERISQGLPIQVFNYGEMQRDFTYIDDIVGGIMKLLNRAPAREGETPPHRVYNIGNNQPVSLMRFIEVLEQYLGKKAVIEMLPMQPGDVPATYADISALEREIGYRPHTPIEVGLKHFVDWYVSYHRKEDAIC